MYHRLASVCDWIHLSLDRNQWQVFDHSNESSRFRKAGNFLTIWATHSFSRTLCHTASYNGPTTLDKIRNKLKTCEFKNTHLALPEKIINLIIFMRNWSRSSSSQNVCNPGWGRIQLHVDCPQLQQYMRAWPIQVPRCGYQYRKWLVASELRPL
jgi:hypothetical protein